MKSLGFALLTAALASTLLLGSCSPACGCSPPPDRVRAEVVEPSGKGIPGIAVEMQTGAARPVSRATGADGVALFYADTPGPHRLRVIPAGGYALPAGAPDTATVSTARGDATVRFTLVPPGGANP